MPDKPAWFGRLDEITAEIASLPRPWIDRQMIETILGVRRRRAQQILAGCGEQAGASLVADKEQLIRHLQAMAAGKESAAWYEQQRRRRFGRQLAGWKRDWAARPRVLVEAPAGGAADLGALPEGVEVSRGEIRVRFGTVTEGLEKLLALALAIGGDLEGFSRRAGVD
jgi:hypothetical protein